MDKPWRELKLTEFDWSELVEKHFFEQVLIGTIAGGLGLIIIDPAGLPDWLLYSVPVSILSFAVAFTRIWKTIREEHETGPLWDHLLAKDAEGGAGLDHLLDRVFEIPYLFSILALPFSAISWQAFALCLTLFYICDNYYNACFVAGVAEQPCLRSSCLKQPTRPLSYLAAIGLSVLDAVLWRYRHVQVADPDQRRFIRFFQIRIALNQFAVWLLLGASLVVWIVMLTSPEAAEVASSSEAVQGELAAAEVALTTDALPRDVPAAQLAQTQDILEREAGAAKPPLLAVATAFASLILVLLMEALADPLRAADMRFNPVEVNRHDEV